MTTSAIRRRYGWGAARLCIEAQPVRYEKTPPLLPNATSGAATVLIGGLAVFALLRSIEPPDELPSEIQIVQLQELEPEPPPPEQLLQPHPEPEPPPAPEPIVVAQAPPPPAKPAQVKRKPEAPKRREPSKPKPEPVHVAPEPPPLWKRAPITPPAPRPEPPPAARRPPPVQIEPPKPLPQVVESAPAPAWKPVAIAQKAPPKAAAPRIAIDAVNAPSSAPPELPIRATSAPPGAPTTAKPAVKMPNVRPVVPAAAAPDFAADSAPSPMLARNSVPTAIAPAPTKRPPPKRGLAMPGISTARDSEPSQALDARGHERPGVTAPPAAAARSEPNAKLRGVPLGSLAACRTDRLEDDLKQKVLAAVRNREECASAAGRYRFVETKNLNAFLLWIERAPGRAEGDRCAELSYALSCLRGGAR